MTHPEYTAQRLRDTAAKLEEVAYGLCDRTGAKSMNSYVAADAISRAVRDIRANAREIEERAQEDRK